ncbi:DUF1684 domain-containing protein [Pedobacter sp. KR3-3]|uniref:DUF1684 domain-containing protein n=1 Tax=Pedobacter albus TaxID=3113905 RepID=A0ABU7I2R1_9SPHI|nr:DUF1684 domain-containing protein [Pedobacter sp. KR3-3]MEE1943752.1 DUF1684 domain-containing protein [Pedobacter sp. KR3-3]
MKYLLSFLLLFSITASAQNYQQTIAKHREAYKADFLKEERSPLKEADLANLDFFKPDSTYRVQAQVSLLNNEKTFKMPTYAGTTADYIRYAKVDFKLNGQTLSMTLYRSIALLQHPQYKDLLFLPFTDETNNKSTYGGGRYIDLDLKTIKNGKIEIDFNKAYNPYCAYSSGYRCPIPPEENDLATAIQAGEKLYKGEKKH